MNKVKQFFINYKKIIVGALLFLIFASVVTTTGKFIYSCQTILSENTMQMERIIQNEYVFQDNLFDLSEQINKPDKDNGKLLSVFLAEFNEDVNKGEILRAYFEALATDEFRILNNNREVVYQYENATKIDFTDSYYDNLFDFKDEHIENIQADYGNSIISKNDDRTILYAFKSGDYTVIVESDNYSIDEINSNDSDKWRTILNNSKVNDKSFVLVVDKENGEVIFCEDEQLIGKNINTGSVKDAQFNEVEGTSYLVNVYAKDDFDLNLYALTPINKILLECLYNSSVECILFFFLIVVLIAYIVFLREDELDPSSEFEFKGKFFLRTQVKRFAVFSLFLGIITIIVLIGILDLNLITEKTEYLKKEVEGCVGPIEQYLYIEGNIADEEDDIYYKYCKMLKAFIENHNECGDKKGLREINNISIGYLMDLESITYFDAYGKTIITSSPLDNLCVLDDKNSSLYELKNVLIGKETMKLYPDTDIMPGDCIVYAISNRDENDYADGIFTVALKNNDFSNVSDEVKNNEESAGTLFELRNTEDESTLFVVDSDGVIILHPEKSLVGKSLEDVGLTKDLIASEYDSIVNIDGKECYAAAAKNSSGSLYAIVTEPILWISLSIVYRIVTLLILFALLVVYMIFDGLGSKYHFESRSAKIKDADDWKNTKVTWGDLNASKKMRITLKCCIYIFALFIVCVYIVTVNNVADITGFSYIVAGNWSKGFNFFSAWGNLCLLCVIYSAIQLFCRLMNMCAESVGDESSTAFHVLSSVTKYAGAILAFSLCAKNFGFDTKTILASIGIIGFGLTFGAQDMIQDMIAGMFILFEGNYKVGDMLMINGDWYWVDSIGVRTTKVSAWGQVMVINNSNMTDVINIQNASDCVNCDITICNENDINDVITILNDNLPKMKENFPPQVSTPVYKGIQEYSGDGTTIRIRAYCPPIEKGWVGRSIRAEIKRIFDEYDILLSDESVAINVEVDKTVMDSEMSANAKKVKEAAQRVKESRVNT